MSLEEKPKYGGVIEGAEQLSLGVSIIVAVLLGIGLGLLMRDMFGIWWLLWVGVSWGIGGAILNIYKAYKKNVSSYDELKPDVRYKKYQHPEANSKNDDHK